MANVVYARDVVAFPMQPSLFLAGPTPRDKLTKSWRTEVVTRLSDTANFLFFDGAVYVPEHQNWGLDGAGYEEQVRWEWHALQVADCILFWIPRHLDTLPGLTTNVEFGMYWNSGKVVVGGPPDAAKNRYLQMLAKRAGLKWYEELTEAIWAAKILAHNRFTPPNGA